MSAAAALDTSPLDQAVSDLREHAPSWTATPLDERIALLERTLPRIADGAAAMVADAATAKGYAETSEWAAEDWITAPWALAQTITAYLHVLRRLAAGKEPIDPKSVRSHEGRTVVDVFPTLTSDRLLLNGFTAQVWTLPGTTREQVLARAAGSTADVPASRRSPSSSARGTSPRSLRSTSSRSCTRRARSSSPR